jgi:bifunctional N-acetylglucosamine-1-phosphate-uridyltransferase/glucosamine-1-phosphate-acetyltransferase GlmU-like protein
MPWEIIESIQEILFALISDLDAEFTIKDGIAIHQTAAIEQNVVMKAPVIVCKNVTVGANAYLRSGVLLDEAVHIGAGCEIKQSVIFYSTAVAHLNYIGNSIIGSDVNFEAGSVAANHFNERRDKAISVRYEDSIIKTGVEKFGSLVGDGCRVGANAVLSPGTLLLPGTVVRRLELVEQVKS